MTVRFQRMTRPAIRTLQAGERINEHGITAERLRNGDLRYSINIMCDGARIHRVVGRESEGVTREQAERTIEAMRTKAREGRLDLPAGRKVHRTFADVAEEYLTRIEHHPKHGKNIVSKRRHIRQRLSPYFKGQRPDKLTDFSLAHYVKHRKGEGASVATINRELSTLSHFLGRCMEWGWISKRPKIDKGEETRKQIVILSAKDQKALMQAAIADQDPLTWLFTAIAMAAAMRHSEILRVRWEEIDFANRRIHIGRAKAGHRMQPIPIALADTLRKEHQQLGEPDGWVFPTRRADAKHPNRQSMSEQFARAVVRANLDPRKCTPHVLRHTAITGLVRAGVDLPTIQKISGHKTLAMVLRYTHLTDDHIDESVSALDIAFSAAITPELHTPENQARRGAA